MSEFGDREAYKKEPLKKKKGFMERIKADDRINFARHLAMTLKAGLPIFEALKILRNQEGSRMLRKVLDQVIIDVSNGQFLADSLSRYEHIFGAFFINVVRVGESSGTLGENLIHLAEDMKKSRALRRKVRSAMIYPIVILFATVAITSILVFFVLPKVLPVFTGLGVELPLTTRILVASTNFLGSYGLWILGGGTVLFFVARFLMRVSGFRYIMHRSMLSIPIMKRLLVRINIANSARVLAVLLRSGIRIVEAVKVTSDTAQNEVYRRSLKEAAEKIRTGARLAEHLALHKKIYPPLVVSMVEIGENTGNLEDNLVYLSDYYTEETDAAIRDLTSLLEPALLLVMGVMVGFIALAIITPIYSITQGI